MSFFLTFGLLFLLVVTHGVSLINLAKTRKARDAANDCRDQHRKLYSCLIDLQERMQLVSINSTLGVLSNSVMDPFLAQVDLLNKYDGVLKAFGKCRKLDNMFDACAPVIPGTIEPTNETLYVFDRLDCMRLTYSHQTFAQSKKVVLENIDANCFQRSFPTINPCIANDVFQKCMRQELNNEKLLWLVNRDAVEQTTFANAYDETSSKALNRWQCYECVYLTDEKCRPSIMQHDCALGQQNSRSQAFNEIFKQCMNQKGYEDAYAQAPDLKSYLRNPGSRDADFCGWIIEDMWM